MDCQHIPELSSKELGKKFQNFIGDDRYPLTGSLELTFRCNVRCKHCYLSYGHSGIPGQDELSYKEIQRILDEITDAGCLWLLLTGGEPMMRRDFVDIYTYAKKKGLLLTLLGLWN